MSFRRTIKGEWAEALEKVLIKDVDEVPSDFLTSEQACKKLGVSLSQGTKWLAMMKKAGVVEMKKFKIKTKGKTGVIRSTDHYRLTSLPNKKILKVQRSY